MKNIPFYIISICILLLSSCNDEVIEVLNSESVVVEGYLFANNPLDSFRVTQSFGYTETSDEITTFDDLSITINDGSSDYALQSIGDGYYQNLDLTIESGKNYAMEFESDGVLYSSESYVPEKTEISLSISEVTIERVTFGVMTPPTQTDPITISWDNSAGDYYYVVVENIEPELDYINANFANTDFERPVIITEPLITSDHNVDSRRDIQLFGTYQIIVYRVNPEYAALYSTSESTSTTLVEPASNIENGLGIMTGISSDTIYFEVNEF